MNKLKINQKKSMSGTEGEAKYLVDVGAQRGEIVLHRWGVPNTPEGPVETNNLEIRQELQRSKSSPEKRRWRSLHGAGGQAYGKGKQEGTWPHISPKL